MSFHKTIFGKPNNAREIEKTGHVQRMANNSMYVVRQREKKRK